MNSQTRYRLEQSDTTSCCMSTCWGQESNSQKKWCARRGILFAESRAEDKADFKEASATDLDRNTIGAKVSASRTMQETELVHSATTVDSSMCAPAVEGSTSTSTASQNNKQPYLVVNPEMVEQEEDSRRQEIRGKAPSQGQEEVRPKLNKYGMPTPIDPDRLEFHLNRIG